MEEKTKTNFAKPLNSISAMKVPRWSEQKVKTPEQQKLWDEAVKREQAEVAARHQATRDAHTYNAALRWTGQRFNDTVLVPNKFPNISDPTVRQLPPADPNSPLSRAFWNNVKEQGGRGKRTQLTEVGTRRWCTPDRSA